MEQIKLTTTSSHSKLHKLGWMTIGLFLTLVVWSYVYLIELFFAESHLGGYYCCVTEEMLPASGTWARASSDFFTSSAGENLVPMIFLGVSLYILASRMFRKGDGYHNLPCICAALSIIYVVSTFLAAGASWKISNSINGPSLNAYDGYDQAWIGILFHFTLWSMFFTCLYRIPGDLFSGLAAWDKRHES